MKLILILSTMLPLLYSTAATAQAKSHYHFASIEYLIEQEVGKIVLTQIYQQLDLSIAITPLPANRAQYKANNGTLDGEIMRIWSYGDENPDVIRVPTPYYYLETMPFVRANSDIEINQQAELKKYRIGRVRGVKHTNNITQNLTGVYDFNSTKLMFELLEQNKIDIGLTNTFDGEIIIKSAGFNNIKPMKNPLVALPLYHYIHKKDARLVPIIDQHIRHLTKTGELNSLIKHAESYVIEQKMAVSRITRAKNEASYPNLNSVINQ